MLHNDLSGLQQAAMTISLPHERLQKLSLTRMGRCPGLLQLEPFKLIKTANQENKLVLMGWMP